MRFGPNKESRIRSDAIIILRILTTLPLIMRKDTKMVEDQRKVEKVFNMDDPKYKEISDDVERYHVLHDLSKLTSTEDII